MQGKMFPLVRDGLDPIGSLAVGAGTTGPDRADPARKPNRQAGGPILQGPGLEK